jgi:hypothetical protein
MDTPAAAGFATHLRHGELVRRVQRDPVPGPGDPVVAPQRRRVGKPCSSRTGGPEPSSTTWNERPLAVTVIAIALRDWSSTSTT